MFERVYAMYTIQGSYHFLLGGGHRGGTEGGGDENCFAHAEGAPEFFCACQGGDQKKLATRDHKQTAPLRVKNDSSLMTCIE